MFKILLTTYFVLALTMIYRSIGVKRQALENDLKGVLIDRSVLEEDTRELEKNLVSERTIFEKTFKELGEILEVKKLENTKRKSVRNMIIIII